MIQHKNRKGSKDQLDKKFQGSRITHETNDKPKDWSHYPTIMSWFTNNSEVASKKICNTTTIQTKFKCSGQNLFLTRELIVCDKLLHIDYSFLPPPYLANEPVA